MSDRELLRAVGILGLAAGMIAMSRWHASPPTRGWRAQFTAAAKSVHFTADRPPEADSGLRADLAIPEAVLNLRIAVPRTADTSQAGRLVFRITSDRGYPRLGLARGINYVWQDGVGARSRLLVIPADTNADIHWLTVKPHRHLIAPRNMPRLLMLSSKSSYGQQFQILPESVEGGTCSRCDSQWCIAKDTSPHLRQVALAPVDSMRRYFKRLRIRWVAR